MAALVLPSRRIVQPQDFVELDPYWLGRSPVLVASGGSGFVNAVNGKAPVLGSAVRFQSSAVGMGVNGTASTTASTIGFEDYPFGGTTPITALAFSDERAAANRSFLAQDTEVILRVSAAGTGVEWILNSFATNDRATAVANSRASPGFFAAGTYGPSGRLRAYANTAMAEVTPTGSYANATGLFSAVYTQGLNQLFDKKLALVALFRSELSQAELKALSENPWQLFRPISRSVYFLPADSGGGPASQTVAFTLDDVSANAAQTRNSVQSASATLDDVTASAAQTSIHPQSAGFTLDGIAFAASQAVEGSNAQSLAITLDGVAFSASQVAQHTQSATIALDGLTFAASQSVGSPLKSQSVAFTLDDVGFDANQIGPAPSASRGFTFQKWKPKLWWVRKPRSLNEEEAEEKLEAAAQEIAKVASKQIKRIKPGQPVAVTKPQKAEVREAIAPLVADMPGFDWVGVYKAILERLAQEKAEQEREALRMAQIEIERIRQIDDEEVLMLLMEI
jgi:hypothetical protein